MNEELTKKEIRGITVRNIVSTIVSIVVMVWSLAYFSFKIIEDINHLKVKLEKFDDIPDRVKKVEDRLDNHEKRIEDMEFNINDVPKIRQGGRKRYDNN